MNRIILEVLLLSLMGCTKEPNLTEKTDNPGVDVDVLFRHEDCAVFRFFDRGRAHYFAKCNVSADTSYSVSNGKTSYRTGIRTEIAR